MIPYGVLSIGLLSIPLFNGHLLAALIVFSVYLCFQISRFGLPSLDQAAMVWLASIMLFDIPSGRPYNEYTAWTETLGHYFFSSLAKAFSIPVPLTLFELGSFALVAGIWLRYRMSATAANRRILFVALILPGIAGLSALLGFLRGNDLALAVTQIRSLPTFTAWCLISYFLSRRLRNIRSIYRVVLFGAAWKAAMGLYVFYFVYGGELGSREYLIDHLSSLIMASALLMLLMRPVFFPGMNRLQLTLSALLFVWIAWPYWLNDRRASMLGLALGLFCLPFMLHQVKLIDLKRRVGAFLLPFALLTMAVGGIVLFSQTAVLDSLQAIIAGGERMDQPSYRALEDYNLLHGVQFSPLLGLGFGSRYPIMVLLPDISTSFDLFDAIPHNQVLYLWTFCGPLGMMALGLVMTLSLQASVRLCRSEVQGLKPYLGCISAVTLIGWFVFVFYDMGLLTGSALVMAGTFAGIALALDQRG